MLVDDGDGVAQRAGKRLAALGYSSVAMLADGIPGWEAADGMLLRGVNVPTKGFGEVVEHALGTPSLDALALQQLRAEGKPVVVLDGRPPSEHAAMCIPGSICVPNGELILRVADLAPDPATPVVVHCAGRTRSIIGAQTLIDAGYSQSGLRAA